MFQDKNQKDQKSATNTKIKTDIACMDQDQDGLEARTEV